MTTPTDQQSPAYRFRSGKSRLIDEIARIESLASACLEEGVSLQSVHTGALALLRMAVEVVEGELVPVAPTVPACPAALEPPPSSLIEEAR